MAIDERTTQGMRPAVPAMERSSVAELMRRDLAQEVTTPTLAGRLASHLAELERELTERYESETCSALYQDVPSGKPRFERRLASLRREHRALVSRARRLAAMAREAEDASLLAGLRSESLDLLADLKRHEDAEQRLLADAMFVDIGVGD